MTTSVAKGPEDTQGGAQTAAAQGASDATGTVIVETTPNGADVYVDDQFYGNGPETLKLKPGKHMMRVKMAAYKDWSREVSSGTDTEAHLTAMLEKAN